MWRNLESVDSHPVVTTVSKQLVVELEEVELKKEALAAGFL